MVKTSVVISVEQKFKMFIPFYSNLVLNIAFNIQNLYCINMTSVFANCSCLTSVS